MNIVFAYYSRATSAPSSARAVASAIFSNEVAVHIDDQQPSTSSSGHSTNIQPTPSVPSTSTTADHLAAPYLSRGLVRQVTFGVQTEHSRTNLPDLVLQFDEGLGNANSGSSKSPPTLFVISNSYLCNVFLSD